MASGNKPTAVLEWNGEVTQQIVDDFRFVIESGVHRIANRAKKLAPVDTGNLKNRVHAGVTLEGARIVGKVWTDSGYALYIEIGTGIYGPKKQPIRPKNAKMLAWKEPDGTWRFAKEVKGRPATPFMKPALDAEKGSIATELKELVARLTN